LEEHGMKTGHRTLVILVAALALTATSSSAPDWNVGLSGHWRAVLTSPGGELPFRLTFEHPAPGQGQKGPGALTAFVGNGAETVPFSTVKVDGDTVTLRFDAYDSEIVAKVDPSGRALRGAWTKQAGKERPSMPFAATRIEAGNPPRFAPRSGPPGDASVADVTGAWDVVFKDEEGESAARGEFHQMGQVLLGTFLTPTGDYRYLEGDYGGGVLRLSCFDGGHAFLFVARAQKDGSLSGDYWSRTASHATWRATRAQGDKSAMPDPFGMTTLKNPSGRLRFSFPALDGRLVSLADARFRGKVVLVDLFGSWCPNCNDQAPVLVDLYRTYHDRGLEIVGLAYEMTGERERDAVYVRKYAERHHIVYPLLLAGTSDKSEASETLPDLSGVLAFPTLVFVARDGSVKAIHTGFEGPGTGAHFAGLKAKYAALIEKLL
jgi:thiol-disulfide isomerase/thioredoxin